MTTCRPGDDATDLAPLTPTSRCRIVLDPTRPQGQRYRGSSCDARLADGEVLQFAGTTFSAGTVDRFCRLLNAGDDAPPAVVARVLA